MDMDETHQDPIDATHIEDTHDDTHMSMPEPEQTDHMVHKFNQRGSINRKIIIVVLIIIIVFLIIYLLSGKRPMETLSDMFSSMSSKLRTENQVSSSTSSFAPQSTR